MRLSEGEELTQGQAGNERGSGGWSRSISIGLTPDSPASKHGFLCRRSRSDKQHSDFFAILCSQACDCPLLVGPGRESKWGPIYHMTKYLHTNWANTLLNKSCSIFLPGWIYSYDDLGGQVSMSEALTPWHPKPEGDSKSPTPTLLFSHSEVSRAVLLVHRSSVLCITRQGPRCTPDCTICSWEMRPKDKAGTSPVNQPGAVWTEKSGVPSTLGMI